MAEGSSRAWLRYALVALAAILGLALVAELGTAAAAEYRLSREFRAAADLDNDPEVTIGGFPFLTAGGHYSKVTVAASAQVESTPERRTGRIEAVLQDAVVPGGTLPSPTADTRISAAHVESRVRLDQKTFGRYLGIVDLQVHTPAPKRAGAGSPADGYVKSATGVVLTGTVALPSDADPGRTVSVSVSADFSAADGGVAVRATRIYTGPEDHADAQLQPGEEPRVLAAFTRTLPAMPLPFGVPPTGARGENADVVLYGEAEDTVVTPGTFYPPQP